MATSNLKRISIGFVEIQSGNGIPNHSGLLSTTYTDVDTGYKYQNIDGNTGWIQLPTPFTISATTISADTIVISKRISNLLIPITTPTTKTIDWSTSNTFDYTLSGNTIFSFSNVIPGQTTIVAVRQPTSTGYTYTFSGSSVNWQNSSTPIITTTSGRTDIYTFVSLSGSSIYGSAITNF